MRGAWARWSSALALAALVACDRPGAPVRFTVPKGATTAVVADTLAARGVVGSRLLFRLAARLAGIDRRLKPGLYELPSRAGLQDVIAVLREGRVVAVRLTVREGLTLYELADLAQAKLGLDADAVIAAATDRAAAQTLAPGAPSFEGFLFPETYDVPGDATPRAFVATLADQFRAVWDSTDDAKAAALGLTKLQAVTLASLVEGEARVPEERAVIAGVYWNRWKIGMALQADPTVQYAIVQQRGERKARLYLKDYDLDSPYNTYRVNGFPPGPVNSPGRAALDAALAPARHRYLYFVAGPDGRHRFAESFEAHKRNVAAMRRAWADVRRNAAR